jgi:hypothetical protein
MGQRLSAEQRDAVIEARLANPQATQAQIAWATGRGQPSEYEQDRGAAFVGHVMRRIVTRRIVDRSTL